MNEPLGALRRFRAVLFDLDGVLVDSYQAWYVVVNEAARRFGAPPIDRDRLEDCFGQGLEEDARDLYPGTTVEEVKAAYDESMPANVAHMTPNPEARAVLRDLGRAGVARAIVTNTQISLGEAILAAANLRDVVDCVVGAGGGPRPKPHPDLLQHALTTLEVPPEAALMVGDTDYDERAARAAGVRFLHYEMRRGTSLRAALLEAALA